MLLYSRFKLQVYITACVIKLNMLPILFCIPYFEENDFKNILSKLRLKIESYSNNEEIINT